MVRFALPFGAFTRLWQDSHKRDILGIFGKIEEGHNPKVVGSNPALSIIKKPCVHNEYKVFLYWHLSKFK